jgi:prepilin-type N-terminal cleavage/methylation domain-containing protein
MNDTFKRFSRPSWAEDGFTLIEVLISLVVILFSFMAALTVLTSSYRSGSYAELQTMAIFLTESKLEELRHLTPKSLASGVPVDDYFDRHCGRTDDPKERFFKRTVSIKRETPSQFTNEVKVEVKWPGGRPIVYMSIIPVAST